MGTIVINKKIIKPFFMFITIASLMLPFSGITQVSAAPVVGFNPGYIISDNIFTNSKTMTTAQIQAFLLSKVPVCDTWGTGGSTPTARRDFIRSYGYDVPLKCLIDYTENGKTAAQIIYDVAQEYQINPQVLIVLLQKEQGLVTDDWPGPWQYKTAAGYGCPDTALCNTKYYGLTAQLTWAATLFHTVISNNQVWSNEYSSGTSWFSPYTIGNNKIYYNPGPCVQTDSGGTCIKRNPDACGSSIVNIQDRSTQALYDYTPYQPNQSALNAGYGDGGPCGAYGNRNFYLYFSDWFGSPLYGNLVRTVDDASVYLVSGDIKYPIADMATLSSLSPLGNITYVSQAYVDSKTTGNVLGRAIISSSGGTVYYFDSGIKLPFTSCSQVADYGYDCGQPAVLTGYQISTLYPGPAMTNIYITTNGKRFYVKSGEKKEVYDDASLQQIGVSVGANVLNESAISNLKYGMPVVRNDVFVKNRSDASTYLYTNGALGKVDSAIQPFVGMGGSNLPSLDQSSISMITKGPDIGGYIKATDGTSYIVLESGKLKISSPADWNQTFNLVSDAVLSQIPDIGSAASPYAIKSDNSNTVYEIVGGKKRPIASWGDLLAISPKPMILNLPAYYVNSLTDGARLLAPGQLVKSADNGTVYMIDGLSQKIAMGSFNASSELGFNNLQTVSNDILNEYATYSNSNLTDLVQCGVKQGIAMGGVIYPINISGASYIKLDDLTCARLNWGELPGFILDQSGTIYQLSNSQKLPITGYPIYIRLGGVPSNTIKVSGYSSSLIPTGNSL